MALHHGTRTIVHASTLVAAQVISSPAADGWSCAGQLWYRRSVPIKPWSKGSSAMMCSRFVRTTRPIATMSMLRMVSRMTANASCPTSSPVSAVHLGVFDAMASLSVDLVEADFLGIRSGRIQSDRTGNKRKAQKAFPVGTGAIEILQTLKNPDSRRSCLIGSDN